MTKISLKKPADLSANTIESVFELHSGFFRNLDKKVFISDLLEKDFIIVSEDTGKPVAFSTIKIHDENPFGERTIFIFSGDTIVHPAYWSQNILVPAFASFLRYMIDAYRDAKIYWYLITKGYRTYMFLPVLFKEFYPAPEWKTPSHIQALIDYISAKRYGSRYLKDKGIISYYGDKDSLIDEMCEIPIARRANRFIRYFLEKNPDFKQGDELACLTQIVESNIKPAGLKLLGYKGLRWEI